MCARILSSIEQRFAFDICEGTLREVRLVCPFAFCRASSNTATTATSNMTRSDSNGATVKARGIRAVIPDDPSFVADL